MSLDFPDMAMIDVKGEPVVIDQVLMEVEPTTGL